VSVYRFQTHIAFSVLQAQYAALQAQQNSTMQAQQYAQYGGSQQMAVAVRFLPVAVWPCLPVLKCSV
jgi:hypothetical protein